MKKWLFILIILLGALLRLFSFTKVPPGLYIDEVSIGYNAFSILKTGRDEWGVRYPLLFRALDDYKLPAYIYATVVSEAIFGVNEAGVRFPSVMAGILAVPMLYFLTKELGEILKKENHFVVNTEKWGLVAALFLAISPWHLQFSRAGFEANVSLLFVIAGVYFFLRAMRLSKNWLFVSALFFIASIYTYHSARIFTPVFLLFMGALFFNKLFGDWKKTALVIFFTFLIFAPILPTYFSKEGYARLKVPGATQPPGKFIGELTANYLANFSSDFLFFSGDQAGRHSVKKIGELYLWQMPFLLTGIYLLLKTKSRVFLILLVWLLLGAVPPVLASPSPHALRALLDVPAYQVIIALAVVVLWSKGRRGVFLKATGIVFALVVCYAFLTYLHLYYVHYSPAYSFDWQDGVKEAISEAQRLSPTYKEIDYYGEIPYIHLLFYTRYDPSAFQASRHNIAVIGKYNLLAPSAYPVKKRPEDKILVISPYFLVAADNPTVVKEVRLLNGDPIFRLYDF